MSSTTPPKAKFDGYPGDYSPRWPAIAVFLCPALSFLRVDVIGELYLPEIILGAIAISHLLYAKRLALPRWLIIATALLSCWLVAQVLSDLYRDSAFTDYSRGWSKVAFTILNMLGLYLLIGLEVKRLRIAFLGLVVGKLLAFFLAPSAYAHIDPWKFGYGYPLTALVVLLACACAVQRRRFGPLVLVGVMAIVNLYLGARSLAGISAMAGVFTVLIARRGKRTGNVRPAVLIGIAVTGVLAASVASHVYGSLANAGRLGDKAQLKYEIQSAGRFGPLLGGRSEIVFSSLAIRDSPVIGHGSFPKRTADLDFAEAQLVEWGYRYFIPAGNQADLLPTHSHIFGAWVEAGLLGVPFWLWLFALLCRGVASAIRRGGPLAPLQIFVGVAVSWDVLFSPYGADRRLSLPLSLLLMLSALRDQPDGDRT